MTDIPMAQRMALFYIRDNADATHGAVIEPFRTGEALVRRKLAVEAPRRKYARGTGVCLQLTEAGRAYLNEVEGARR